VTKLTYVVAKTSYVPPSVECPKVAPQMLSRNKLSVLFGDKVELGHQSSWIRMSPKSLLRNWTNTFSTHLHYHDYIVLKYLHSKRNCSFCLCSRNALFHVTKRIYTTLHLISRIQHILRGLPAWRSNTCEVLPDFPWGMKSNLIYLKSIYWE